MPALKKENTLWSQVFSLYWLFLFFLPILISTFSKYFQIPAKAGRGYKGGHNWPAPVLMQLRWVGETSKPVSNPSRVHDAWKYSVKEVCFGHEDTHYSNMYNSKKSVTSYMSNNKEIYISHAILHGHYNEASIIMRHYVKKVKKDTKLYEKKWSRSYKKMYKRPRGNSWKCSWRLIMGLLRA